MLAADEDLGEELRPRQTLVKLVHHRSVVFQNVHDRPGDGPIVWWMNTLKMFGSAWNRSSAAS